MKKGMINIAGAADGRVALLASEIISEHKGQSLIVVPTEAKAKRLAQDLSFFAAQSSQEGNIYVLPADDDSLVQYEAKSNDSLLRRMQVLRAVTSGEPCVVIAPVTGAIRKLPPKEVFSGNIVTIRRGDDVDLKDLAAKLSLMGYERVAMIEARGEFSLRGGILDIFTPEAELPYRIEFFDTEVDAIRSFDPETQRSVDAMTDVTIYQCSQIAKDEEVFAKASDRIRRAYDRKIKKLEKRAAQAETEKTGGAGGTGKAETEKAGSGTAPSQIKTEQTAALRQRRDQLIEYAEGMINLQYMEKFLNYFYDETEYIWDYMGASSAAGSPDAAGAGSDGLLLMIDDPARILETLDVYEKKRAEDIAAILEEGRGIGEDFSAMSGAEDFYKLYEFEGIIFTPFVSTIKNAPFLTELRQVNCRQTPTYNGRLDALKKDLESYMAKGYTVTIVCSNPEREKNIREFLEREKLLGAVTRENATFQPGTNVTQNATLQPGTNVALGEITAGMDFPERRIAYIWEGDIFGAAGHARTRRRRRSYDGADAGGRAGKNTQKIKTFADVQTGDYVVHETHGIGRFTGIEQLVVQGVKRDYLKVKYAGEDSLYIPVDQLGLLQKYIGGGGDISPRLNKLSGNEWRNTKAKAKAAVTDMAADLIRVSAERMNAAGFAFSEDTVWQNEFEDSFPYTETDDQLKCIDEIKFDMEQPVPMDRLLCGDVGFGKTEVAARALFKCVADGKQAAVLVPTTLLANQHFYTLKERFEKFPFRVEMLSRFKTSAQQKQIVDDIRKGQIDLVIGTHRLLSSDVKFKDLGLLVVDEEQRFGVKHKERIKQLRAGVDVLTLSATPIPRTLHMSLSGIKDMSTIEEPPEDRYPVQTYVMEEDDFVIREAIEKELARGGQVYVLYNKVESIGRMAARIRQLVPSAAVKIGHGQMREAELEDIILDFNAGEFDVLVSTTIIESGMDIPNVNTMIIMDADRFGLAQLYQLRGRVGRTDRVAYAYLMYRRDRNLSEIAEKRLRAIRDFTEFGSGFRIAMKDLELRGAGNLLGTEQSGHMLSIGYELYCKLLDEAVQRLRYHGGSSMPHGARLPGDACGQSELDEIGINIGTDGEVMPSPDETVFSIGIPAIISERYIADEMLRLQMYKKIAVVETAEDEADVIDELIDRFGDVPQETLNLIRISRIRSMAGRLGVREISALERGLAGASGAGAAGAASGGGASGAVGVGSAKGGGLVKFALWENVRFGENVVPNLLEKYGQRIKFTGGKTPSIRVTIGTPVGTGAVNSLTDQRRILDELTTFLETANA